MLSSKQWKIIYKLLPVYWNRCIRAKTFIIIISVQDSNSIKVYWRVRKSTLYKDEMRRILHGCGSQSLSHRQAWLILSGFLWVGSGPERQRLTALPISCFFCQGNFMLWFIFLCLYVVICVINTCKNLLLKAISKIVNWWIKSLELTLLCFALGLCNIVSSTLNQSINLTCFNRPHNENSRTVLSSLSVTLSTFLHLVTDILLLKNNGTFVSCQNPT